LESNEVISKLLNEVDQLPVNDKIVNEQAVEEDKQDGSTSSSPQKAKQEQLEAIPE